MKRLKLKRLSNEPLEFTVDSSQGGSTKLSDWLLVEVLKGGDGGRSVVVETGLILNGTPLTFRIPLKLNPLGSGGTIVKVVGELKRLKLSGTVAGAHLNTFTLSRKGAAYQLLLQQTEEWIKKPAVLGEDLLQMANYFRESGMTGLKTFLRRRLQTGSVKVQSSYQLWLSNFSELREKDRADLKNQAKQFKYVPEVSLLVPVYNSDPRWLRRMVESVQNQIYPHWELCLVDDASSNKEIRPLLESFAQSDSRIKIKFRKKNGHISAASNDALKLASAEFVGLLDHDDELTTDALFRVVEQLNRDPKLNLIYSDEDKIDASGTRSDPHFKTDWNPDLFYSANVVCHFTVLRKSMVELVGGFRKGFEGSQDYDLVLRVSEQISPSTIHHIPRVLYHWRIGPGSTAVSSDTKAYAPVAARAAITEHFKRKGIAAEVLAGYDGFHRVSYQLPATLPKVSLIIPTRDRVELLQSITRDILSRTDYPNLELIIVDNRSESAATQHFLAELSQNPRVKVLADHREFNFSAINNRAVEQTTGEIIGFLNNDLGVINPDWLTEMVRLAGQPEIGVVGAKLFYPDNTIQHAGIVLGIRGIAGHSLRGLPRREAGYMSRANLIQGVSAVTAACLLTRKSVFESVQGFDEKKFAVAFNDVDYCLKVRAKGLRIVMTPYAELYHYESASRGSDTDGPNRNRFEKESKALQASWGEQLENDPFYNPNLTLDAEDFSLAFPPRLR